MKPLIALAFVLTLASPAFAQPDPTMTAITKATQNFKDCVYASIAAQMKETGSRDLGLLAESAFPACLTEETILALLIKSAGVTRDEAVLLLNGNRLKLKEELQRIAANPARYR